MMSRWTKLLVRLYPASWCGCIRLRGAAGMKRSLRHC